MKQLWASFSLSVAPLQRLDREGWPSVSEGLDSAQIWGPLVLMHSPVLQNLQIPKSKCKWGCFHQHSGRVKKKFIHPKGYENRWHLKWPHVSITAGVLLKCSWSNHDSTIVSWSRNTFSHWEAGRNRSHPTFLHTTKFQGWKGASWPSTQYVYGWINFSLLYVMVRFWSFSWDKGQNRGWLQPGFVI